MGHALTLTHLTERFPDEILSVVLYWKQRKGPDSLQSGHSALIVDAQEVINNAASSNFYVSWLGKAEGSNPFVRLGEASTYEHDMKTWGGFPRGMGDHRVPTRWVALRQLKTGLMLREWDKIRSNQAAHWKLADKNCATTVARVLKAGGSDQYATKAKSQLVWWPTDLITYAKSMGNEIVCASSDA